MIAGLGHRLLWFVLGLWRPVARMLLLAIGVPAALLVGMPFFIGTLGCLGVSASMAYYGHTAVALKFLWFSLPAAALTALGYWPLRLAARLRDF